MQDSEDILLQLFGQEQQQQLDIPQEQEGGGELQQKDHERVESFLDKLFKNANGLAIASSTFTTASILTGSFAVFRLLALPTFVATTGYMVAVMGSAFAALEQLNVALHDKGFSLEVNPEFWKASSRAVTIATVGYHGLAPYLEAENRAKEGTKRYYEAQKEFVQPVDTGFNWSSVGVAAAATVIFIFIIKSIKK